MLLLYPVWAWQVSPCQLRVHPDPPVDQDRIGRTDNTTMPDAAGCSIPRRLLREVSIHGRWSLKEM